jgi:hypothetical protein
VFTLCLALVIATVGARASFSGGTAPDVRTRIALNVAMVTGLSAGLAFAGCFADGLAPWLIGTWFAALAAVYAGHAFAVRNWGSPMSRYVFLFGLGKLHRFARTKPLPVLAAFVAMGLVFGAGWTAAAFDEPAAGRARMLVYLGSASVLLGCAAVVSANARMNVRSDLVLGLLLGGYGPMSGPPPEDPSLGLRWKQPPAISSARANVIVFVVDSLRSANMSAYGYGRPTTPFLDTLVAERGARAVPLAVTNSPATESAYWSLFSSRRTRHLAVNAPCLHDRLRAAGFTVRFFLSGAHRHWMGMEYLYGPDYDTFVDCLIDDQLVAHARKLPAASAGARNFLFFHLMSTHQASGCEPAPVWKPARNRVAWSETDEMDAHAREQMRNHYDNSVLQADGCIAGIMGELRHKGYLDNALVVVTSDHGEALGERDPVMIGHGRGLYQESIQIPLIVWDSTQALPEPVFLADHTDIAPTILAWLGMESPSAWQGSAIFAPPGRRTAHIEHIAHRAGKPPTHMEALIALLPAGVFKIMRYRQAGREVLRRTFCLSADPGENEDLSGHLPADVEAEIERALGEHHDQPALALSTNWSFLDRAV